MGALVMVGLQLQDLYDAFNYGVVVLKPDHEIHRGGLGLDGWMVQMDEVQEERSLFLVFFLGSLVFVFSWGCCLCRIVDCQTNRWCIICGLVVDYLVIFGQIELGWLCLERSTTTPQVLLCPFESNHSIHWALSFKMHKSGVSRMGRDLHEVIRLLVMPFSLEGKIGRHCLGAFSAQRSGLFLRCFDGLLLWTMFHPQ